MLIRPEHDGKKGSTIGDTSGKGKEEFMDVNAQIGLLLEGIEQLRKAKEPFHINLSKFKNYQDILNLLNLLSDHIKEIKADDINDRLSEHMIIVTWKEEEIDFPKRETEILDNILELCDGLLINNKQNDWAFFVEICE